MKPGSTTADFNPMLDEDARTIGISINNAVKLSDDFRIDIKLIPAFSPCLVGKKGVVATIKLIFYFPTLFMNNINSSLENLYFLSSQRRLAFYH